MTHEPHKNRKIRAALASFCFLVTAAGCAPSLPPGPVHFYASWSGNHPPTGPVFEAVDARMRSEAGFLRDFDDALHIEIDDGVRTRSENLRFDVRFTLEARIANKRISKSDQALAEFSVFCTPDKPQPCVDEIVRKAQLERTKIQWIVARSPRA